METLTASVYSTGSVPRLRVTRRMTSPTTSDFNAEQGLVPRPISSKRSASYPDSQTNSEDDSEVMGHAEATSRLLSASLPPPDSSAQSNDTGHRLRAILNRFDTSSHTPTHASRVVMPPSPSDLESDFDLPPVQAARASIKDLFKTALREPGDTPQKPGPARRASFNAVESPKVRNMRRKSTSDEEMENFSKHRDEKPINLSTAASLDRLRLQLTESMPSIQDASSSTSTSRPRSEAAVSVLKRAAPSHLRTSKIPVSNSPVKHAKTHQDLEPFSIVNEGEDDDLFSSPRKRNHSRYTSRAQTPITAQTPHVIHGNGSDLAVKQPSHESIPHVSSRTNSLQSDTDYRERLRDFQHEMDIEPEENWNRRYPPPSARIRTTSAGNLPSSLENKAGRVGPGPWHTPPSPGSSPSSIRSPKQSLTRRETNRTDGHSEDGRSSRATSTSSSAEYRDQLKEAERERQRELERNWNRPHPQSVHRSHIDELHIQGDTSQMVPSLGHSRPHSRPEHDHIRPDSPSLSSTSSQSRHDDDRLDVQREIEREQKQNWNAPRQNWRQHSPKSPHGPEVDHDYFSRVASPPPSHPHDNGDAHRHNGSSTPISLSANGHSHSRPQSRLEHDTSRSHSRLDNGRDYFPLGSPSSTSSHSHQEDEIDPLHQRERNWNAPPPRWEQYPHHSSHSHEAGPLSRNAPSPAPTHEPSVDRERERSWGRHRTTPLLGVPTNGRSPRPVSQAPHSHPHSTSSNLHHIPRSKSPVPPAHISTMHQSRPNSPLFSDGGQENRYYVDLEKSRNLSQRSPSHRHERKTLPPSPIPSQPGPKPLNAGSPGQTQSHSVVPAQRTVSPPSPDMVAGPIDAKKGHRRTTTELSESMGPFPRKSSLPSALTVPDESDGSLFADESVPPPQMSTPTFKAAHFADLSISPAASDIPLPPSPPSPIAIGRNSTARAEADLQRLHKAVAPDFAFPVRQPSLSSPIPGSSLSTPPRRSSFNEQKMEFRTPSPPVGLPDLPGPPSSDEEEAKTPIRANGEARISTLWSTTKTPHFPGAFGTPAPTLTPMLDASPGGDWVASEEVPTVSKLESVVGSPPSPVQCDGATSETQIPASVPPTPAPPGAYRSTPSKRKGILKVRFDGDLHASDGLTNGVALGVINLANDAAIPVKEISPPSSPSSEDVAPANLSPSRRKGLRLVDEYGRERRFTEDGEEIILNPRRRTASSDESPKPSSVNDPTITPRRRANMRQVDALGNAVTEELKPKEEPNEEVHVAKGGKKVKAVFSRLTRSLGELKDDLAEEENLLAAAVPESGLHDNERLLDLATVSKAARVERNRLVRMLQLERHAESGIADKVFVARHPSRDLPPGAPHRLSWWRRNWGFALILVLLEVVVMFVLYRLAMMHAKQLWLATYFDPFFPALYLQKSRPNFLHRLGSLPMDWSAFAISDTVRRVGVRGFMGGIGQRLWESLVDWELEPWEAWGSPAAGPPVPRAWPPS